MNESRIQHITNEIENSPFLKHLGFKIHRWNKGKCEIFVPLTDNICNTQGEIKWGVCSILCYASSYIVACTLLQDGNLPVNYSSKISLISSVTNSGLYVYSSTEEEANYLIESKVYDTNQNLIAVGTNCYN